MFGRDGAREQNTQDGYHNLVPESSLGNTVVKGAQEEEEAGTPAGIDNNGADLYDAVVVAAFGGVTQLLDGCGPSLVHPFFLFLLSIPLSFAQVSAIFYLRLDLDLTDPVHSTSSSADKRDMLLALKMLMVVIVQLFMFGRLMHTVQQFVFLLNPTTWEDIHRPDPAKMKMSFGWIFRPCWTKLWPMLAMIAHGLVDYNICIDSVSIILGAKEVKQAIYDSLAITFVADLSTMWWDVTSTVFHFESFSTFQFLVGSEKWREDVRKNAKCPIPACIRKWWIMKKLERGHWGKSFELGATFLILFFIYGRQVLVIAHALHTDILPVARDVCTLWRVQTTGGYDTAMMGHIMAHVFRNFESHLLPADPTDIIEDVADPDHRVKGHHAGYCNTTYDRLTTVDMFVLVDDHPMLIWGSLAVIFIFLGLPQVHYLTYWLIRRQLYPREVIVAEEAEATRFQATHRGRSFTSDGFANQAEVDDLRKEVQELKTQLETQLKEVQELKTQLETQHLKEVQELKTQLAKLLVR